MGSLCVYMLACLYGWTSNDYVSVYSCGCGAICVYAPVHVWFCVLFGVVINLHVCSFCPFCFSACAIVTCVYVCLLPACLFMLVCPYACNYILFSSFSVRYLCAYWSLCINGLEYASLCASVVVRLYVVLPFACVSTCLRKCAKKLVCQCFFCPICPFCLFTCEFVRLSAWSVVCVVLVAGWNDYVD